MYRSGTFRPASAPFCAAALAAWLAGCASPGVTDAPDVLLLTIDTLRGDRWGCLGDPLARTPEMDRFARGGTLAFEGRAPAPITLPSHASLMTGLPPAVHGVRDNGIFRVPPDEGVLLAERLLELGFRTAAFVSALPLGRRSGLDRGFERYDADLGGEGGGAMRQRSADVTVDRVAEWLGGDQAPPAEEPLFLWTHVFDPHAEYEPPPPWREIFPVDAYAAEVAFVDREAGRLFRTVAAGRPQRKRIAVVVSDHGEGLHEHGEASHGALLHAATIRVPIVLREGSYDPRLLAGPRELERVPATVLAALGLPPRLGPGAAPPLGDPPGVVHAETLYPWFNFGWSGLRAREEDGWRLIAGPTDRLYRMDRDPGERRDVAAEHPDVVRKMRDALEREWAARTERAFAAHRRDLPDEEAEALEALGYLSGGGDLTVPPAAFGRGADPHSRMQIVDRINRGVGLSRAGNDMRAVKMLGAVVRDDPANPFALRHLGHAALAGGWYEISRDAFRRALALGPNPVGVYLDLAAAEEALGELDAARASLARARDVDPQSARACHRLGALLLRQGHVQTAAEELRSAVELRPRLAPAWADLGFALEALGEVSGAVQAWERTLELERAGHAAERARQGLTRAGRASPP